MSPYVLFRCAVVMLTLGALIPVPLMGQGDLRQFSPPHPAPVEPGPEIAELRLRLWIETRRVDGHDEYDVRLDLINVTDKPITVWANWPHSDRGTFADYVRSATSFRTHPEIMVWGIQVMADSRRLRQPMQFIHPDRPVAFSWKSAGRRLKLLNSRPNTNRNPYFPSDGLYGVHAELLVHLDEPSVLGTNPDPASVNRSKRTVVLRSNEQLVPVGGSRRAPKQATAVVQQISDDVSTGRIAVGSRHGIEAGDAFLMRTGMATFWRIEVTNAQELTSLVKVQRESLGGAIAASRPHEAPKSGQSAGLVPKDVSDARWMWTHSSGQLPVADVARIAAAVLPGWNLHRIDPKPVALRDGFSGHRIVVRQTWKEYIRDAPEQQKARPAPPDGPFETKHIDWEFVLVPARNAEVPVDLKSAIQWQKSLSPFHTRDVCLGKGHGYMWFTHGTIPMIDCFRRQLGLRGGDDPLQLAGEGLLIKDKGTNTANSTPYILARYGDDALPHIVTAIERAGDDPWKAVQSLSLIHTERATELLLALYDSDDEQRQRSASYALIHEPYRPGAKRAYLDMLARRQYVERATVAAVQFDWQDALPILQRITDQPGHLREYQNALQARRALQGRPIDPALPAAEQTLKRVAWRNLKQNQRRKLDREIAAARRVLIESADTEAASTYALLLCTFVAKGNTEPVRQLGLEILRARPRQQTLTFLRSLLNGIDPDYRNELQQILDQVQARGRGK